VDPAVVSTTGGGTLVLTRTRTMQGAWTSDTSFDLTVTTTRSCTGEACADTEGVDCTESFTGTASL